MEEIRMTMEDCVLKGKCKNYGTDKCDVFCYPYVFTHGTNGKGGLWVTRGLPKKYRDNFKDNLPIEKENPKVYKAVIMYIDDILNRVTWQSRGIYFVGATGTGKTTIVATILNEFLRARIIQHMQGGKSIEKNPVFFVKLAEFQNIYNSQFRGNLDRQSDNADRYSRMKKLMKEVELLVIDDIALRGCTEGFQTEMYEIIDYRATEELCTLFTSNETYEGLQECFGERIRSRIEGMCGREVLVKGTDSRKGGLW